MSEQSFSISAKTCTLKYNNQEKGGTILGEQIKYVVPIYQRPYSWSSEQIKKFISDIFVSYRSSEGEIIEEPMFIGTMQLSEIKIKDNNQVQDIIDGQQRLTTFLLLIKVLQLKLTNLKEIQDISLNWLSTNVSSGVQQKYLSDFINIQNGQIHEKTLNPYINNALIIIQILNDETVNVENDFDFIRFFKYILSNVYFVVIETKAGLSKTLQIFNAINTTGLDLNGGDIFKIRMYEYMRDNKKADENTAFEGISNLYKQIDNKNLQAGRTVVNITGVLHIYQYILISKYNLPTTLYGLSSDTFFERLFDTLLNVNQWEHFKNNIRELELSISDINRIIEVRYYWEELEYPTEEDNCLIYLLWWSRYNRYEVLIYVFLYRFKGEEELEKKLYTFVSQLSKLFTIYSIRFQKAVNEVHSFVYSLTKEITNNSYDEVLNKINAKIGKLDNHKGWYDLEDTLNGDITYSYKVKNIICRLSAMLEEKHKLKDKERKIVGKLFESTIDIEHIQAYNDKNIEERKLIWDTWKHEINSIGNLVVFNSHKNKSNQNKTYEQKNQSYRDSEYKIVQNIVNNYGTWDLKKSIERRKLEVKKIIDYLFNQNIDEKLD